jgi:hypothetical protein
MFIKNIFKCFILIFGICTSTSLSNAMHSTKNHTEYTTIFAHGLGGDRKQVQYYENAVIGGKIIAENGPEWQDREYFETRRPELESCLAQDADIKVITQQMEKLPNENIILLGVSKGAATMINTMGYLSVQKSPRLNNIKAVIVESPFAVPENVALNIIRKSCGSFFGPCMKTSCDTSLGHYVLKKIETKLYPNYKPKGITPIKAVKEQWNNVDKNTVIIFIHSKTDTLISINDSRLLYSELQKLGFKNLYFIEALNGEHGNVFWGPDQDSVIKKLSLIYAKHNLPLTELNLALIKSIDSKQEQALLTEMQPSEKEVYQMLHPWKAWFTKLVS